VKSRQETSVSASSSRAFLAAGGGVTLTPPCLFRIKNH
jgi:hypothetical protein